MFTHLPIDLSELTLISLLIVALFTDISKHRISNSLVFTILICGIVTQFASSGLPGVAYAIFGVVTGFFIFMPFNIWGGMRGGDLKLIAATGAFLTVNTPIAAGLSLIVGAVLGVIVLLWRGGVREYYVRYTNMMLEFYSDGRFRYQPPATHEVAASSFPYALAIVTGVLITLFYFK